MSTQGLTLQQLEQMGAKPAGGLTLDQLKAQQPDHLNGFDVLDKAANFVKSNNLPGAQLGTALGNSFYGIGTAASRALHGDFSGAGKALSDAGDANNKLFEQVVGDVIRSVALPASLAAGGGTSLVKSAATFAGTSAAQGLGDSLAAGKGAGDVAKDTAISGAIGAGAGAASHVISAATKAIVDNLPTRLLRDLTKQSKAELRAGKDVAPTILADKRVGTTEGLIQGAQDNIERLGSQIQSKLAQGTAGGATVSRDRVFNDVAESFNSNGAALDKQEVQNIVGALAPQAKGLLAKQTLTLAEANQLRSVLDRTLGDKAFLKSQLPFNKDVLKQFADTLREDVKAKGPEELRSLFSEQSKEIRLRNVLNEASLAESRKNFWNWRDIISGGIGASLGGLPGIVGGVALERALGSAPFLTGTAVGIDQLGKALGPILSKLEPAERTFIASLISRGVSGAGATSDSQIPPGSTTQ